jgi:hypothetical protein
MQTVEDFESTVSMYLYSINRLDELDEEIRLLRAGMPMIPVQPITYEVWVEYESKRRDTESAIESLEQIRKDVYSKYQYSEERLRTYLEPNLWFKHVASGKLVRVFKRGGYCSLQFADTLEE